MPSTSLRDALYSLDVPQRSRGYDAAGAPRGLLLYICSLAMSRDLGEECGSRFILPGVLSLRIENVE